jgi:hypothetical protein
MLLLLLEGVVLVIADATTANKCRRLLGQQH